MPEALRAALSDPALVHPVLLTLRVAAVTLAVHLVLGLGLGWMLSRRGWRGRGVLDMLVTLPLVFPPIALGFLLLLVLGRRGPIGGWLESTLGVSFVFTVEGVILASIVAGLPLVVKPVEAAIAGLPRSLAEASRTLGRREWETFLFVIVPNIRGALFAGLVMATARAMGEVGITLMLGGNIAGRTNTVSLEIYNAVFNGEFRRALVLSGLLGLISVIAYALMRRAA